MEYLAPSLEASHYDEAAVLGSIVWLWNHSTLHKGATIGHVMRQVLPALQTKQFMVGYEKIEEDKTGATTTRPVFYAAWAYLNDQTEQHYADTADIRPSDWQSGDRFWIIDWIAPFGHGSRVFRQFRRMFPRDYARALRFKTGQKISPCRQYHGVANSGEQAKAYFAQHPLLPPKV